MTLATSKNLTVVGIASILAALATAAVQIFDGDPTTNPDWGGIIALIIGGVTGILAKGAKSTGGTVDGSGTPVKDPAPPVPQPTA